MNSSASTPSSPQPGQPLTPALQAWITTQTSLGRTRQSIFKSMLDAGWLAASASIALQLSDEENLVFGVPPLAELLKPIVALPLPVLDNESNMVDAGDKWVQVLAHQRDLQEVVFGNLLSPVECDALIDLAKPLLLPLLPLQSDALARSGQSVSFERSENAMLQRIEARIAKLLNWPVQSAEGLQIVHYPAHSISLPIEGHDTANRPTQSQLFDPLDGAGLTGWRLRGGRRVALVCVYLSQPDAACLSDWKELETTTQLRRGNTIFVRYPTPSQDAALHHCLKLPQSAAWVAIKWLREREAN
jgi:prolyl 4-hydroxylase